VASDVRIGEVLMAIVDYDTATWNSPGFRKFSPEAKLLLIYLFTNDGKSITGIYKIDFDKMSFDTGIKVQKIAKIIEELKNEVMYDYEKGIVWIIAHTRKQFCRTPNISPKIIKSIENNLTVLRGHCFVGLFLKEYAYLPLFSGAPYPYSMDTVPNGYLYPPGEGGGEGKGIIKKDAAKKGFEKFWAVYPKKKSKGQAEKTFSKINPDEQLLAIMIAKIELAKKSEDWIKEKGKYIPHPATWLNARGWEDEEIVIEQQEQTAQSSPYVICEKCGAEVFKDNFIEEGGQKYCPKCPRIAERGKTEAKQQYEKIGTLIKTIGKEMPAAH
jgi:hypothetical protein